MKRLVLLTVMTLALAACSSVTRPDPAAPLPPGEIHVTLHGHTFNTELATTDATRERGLMFRTHMAKNHAMLFVFRQSYPQSFWMKNTLIPLDILFFDQQRKLVAMQLNAAPCRTNPCPTFPSNVPARYVLELNGGTAAAIGARKGDTLKIKGTIGAVQ